MLNSKVLRLFGRDNLRSTRRRSASCPNLENLSQEPETQGKNCHTNNAFVSTSGSDSDDDATKKFVERHKVQKSIRRVHKKEKEKKENAEKKLISMDDYLGKLSELKTWLKEEQKKDVDNIKSPKLKAHFKTFVKLWNKRKLPLKYYKSCSVDLDNDDSTLSPSYSQQPIKSYLCSPFEESAKFSTPIFHTPFNLPREESLSNVGSPFSTFGKCDLLSSPTLFTEQDTNAARCVKKRDGNTKESSPHKHNKYNIEQSSLNGSPPKFATISRAIPASSLYKFTAQPWSSGENIKPRAVLAPKCPDSQNHFSASFASSPAVTRICSSNNTTDEQAFKTDAHQMSSLTKSPGPSPVYSTTIDAIPYNTGSPKYAEIDESVCNTPQKLSSGYCSISPLQNWKSLQADTKQSVSKKQSLSRRRSKSMEDIYSLPFKAVHMVKVADFTGKDYGELLEMPPIPERKYSPVALPTVCFDQTNNKTLHNNFDDYRCVTSSSKETLSPVSNPLEGNTHKRQSQEGVESAHCTASSLKKLKATLSSNLDVCADLSENSVLSAYGSENASTPVLSILTGSLNPTTRSKYKIDGSIKSCQTSTAINYESQEARLSMIKIQQLDESPKLPRRRLKRRSSSFSTTPGKGLAFGKASKMSAASPRRVSFAKSVKEAENKVTPGKSSPARHNVAAKFTTQTRDRKEFESFLSSHEDLPKTKVSSPHNNSPPKTSSPLKRNSPQKYLENNVSPISTVYPDKCDSIIKKDIFVSKNDESQKAHSKFSTSAITDVGKEGTSPLSLTRQVGRRVLGAPKASPDKNTAGSANTEDENDHVNITSKPITNTDNIETPILSSTRQVGRRVIGPPRASPEKNIADGTSAYFSKKVQNAAPFSPQKNSQVVASVVSPPNHMDVSWSSQKILQSSPEKSFKSTFQLTPSQSSHSTLLQKNMKHSSPSHGTKTTPQNLSPQKHTSPQEQLRSPQRTLSQLKVGTSQLKYQFETKRLFDLPSVPTSKKAINALVSKITEKTSTLCAKELSESDDCLSSDEVFNVSTSRITTSESSNIRPASMKMSPGVSSHIDELHKENEDFIITTLETSPGDKAKETIDCITNCSVISSVDILSIKAPDLALDHISNTAANEIVNTPCVSETVCKSSAQTFDEVSNILTVHELHGLCGNEKTDTESKETYYIPEQNNRYGYRREKEAVVSQCFKLPAVYMTLDHKTCSPQDYHSKVKEVINQAEDSSISDLTLTGHIRKECDNYACIKTVETEVSQASYKVIQASKIDECPSQVASVNSIAGDNNILCSPPPSKNETRCDLKRLASIKASPKVVENDSWITERRRSSRGKRQHSFRSAYNKHLLKSSSKDSEEAEVDQISATESLKLTPSFLDSDTMVAESLEIIDNVQGTLPENASKIVNTNTASDKYQHDVDLVNVATENSIINSPAKVKPATLPKPSKALLRARGNLNAANRCERSTGKAIPKRRSSAVKSETISTTPSRLEKSRIADDNNRTRLSTKLAKPSEKPSTGQRNLSKRVSSGKKKESARKSNEQDKRHESNEQKFCKEESCVLVQDDGQKRLENVQKMVSVEQGCSKSEAHSTRKVSSSGAAGRRRSKNRSIGEKNKVPSFAEKMKFFNQIHTNGVKTQTNQAFSPSCQVKCSSQKVEFSIRSPSKNSGHVSSLKSPSKNSEHLSLMRSPSKNNEHLSLMRSPSKNNEHLSLMRSPTKNSEHLSSMRSPSKNSDHLSLMRSPSKNSEHLSLHRTQKIFLADQDRYSTEIL
ncbi:hypothetical protein BsWGS_12972 [Bradybaena similaris]